MLTLFNYTTFYLLFHLCCLLPWHSCTFTKNLSTLCLMSCHQHLSYASVHEDDLPNISASQFLDPKSNNLHLHSTLVMHSHSHTKLCHNLNWTTIKIYFSFFFVKTSYSSSFLRHPTPTSYSCSSNFRDIQSLDSFIFNANLQSFQPSPGLTSLSRLDYTVNHSQLLRTSFNLQNPVWFNLVTLSAPTPELKKNKTKQIGTIPNLWSPTSYGPLMKPTILLLIFNQLSVSCFSQWLP